MREARPCPHCGAPLPVESATTRAESSAALESQRPSPDADPEEELDLPPVPLLGAGSHDDDFFTPPSAGRFEAVEPNPRLGPFINLSSSTTSTLLEDPPVEPPRGSFPVINLGPGLDAGLKREPSRPEPADAEEFDDDREPEGRRTSWISVLLASYASAVTLGLAWTLMRDGNREKVVREPSRPPVVVTPEPARQVGLSRKVAPPEPILGEHYASMGRPLRVGDLEITPIEVRRQAVALARTTPFAKPDRKDGGKGALVLRLKLKNTSKDAVFSPLDQAYLRERGRGIVDTFIESAAADRIYPFPLAIESEWSIVGQDFSELRPGESRTVPIVSAPDAPPDSVGPFTWRVRLRTGIGRTDAIGLRWPEPSGPR